jgi:branched-chain amino acid transport system ATP-binding protein
MLVLEDIYAAYGSIIALRGVSITLQEGEMVGIVGVNGAGKSTLLKVISGVVKPKQGSAFFQGQSIFGLPPEAIVLKGIALVPEGRRIFPSLTVKENLRIGAAIRRDAAGIQQDIDEMCNLFPVLGERLYQFGGTLSGGEQQQLAIARALMSRPKLLMLDEPSLGLAPILVDTMFSLVNRLRGRGVTILLVEQNVRRTLAIVDRAYLMNAGTIGFSGMPEELLRQTDIESTYLGGSSGR